MDNFNKNLILVDTNDIIIGTTKALNGHYKDSLQLHRAFSMFLFDGKKLLMQQRSSQKLVFPLKWANTVCSHPFLNHLSYSDPVLDSKIHLIQRAEYELGLKNIHIDDLKFIGRVQYKATNDSEESFLMNNEPIKQKFKDFKEDAINEKIIKKSENFYEWEIDYIFICKKKSSVLINESEVCNFAWVDEDGYNNLLKQGEISKWTKIIIEALNIFKYVN
ncbi:isopentenyl-diphosphate-delta-isomerase ii [Vairimorpha apis BRL 01]|uniref:isopentenyl-diphosphate Delta-isomerase n=1 Tax=Vairimorpha apis BRL 01 TaxID=1037528 RepID=T0KWM3_9MICR|nr:isopentenyl-diphosphate-delta-isomerase ii [Vairimorpha apis BRL 01]